MPVLGPAMPMVAEGVLAHTYCMQVGTVHMFAWYVQYMMIINGSANAIAAAWRCGQTRGTGIKPLCLAAPPTARWLKVPASSRRGKA